MSNLVAKKKERKVRGHQIAQNRGLPTREPQDRARAIGEFYVKTTIKMKKYPNFDKCQKTFDTMDTKQKNHSQ